MPNAVQFKKLLTGFLVLLGIGVAPDTELARRAGLALGVKGAISVDGQMRTSAPDVYAVGDAVEVRHFVTGAKGHIAPARPTSRGALPPTTSAGGGAPTLGRWAPRCSSSLT